MIIYRADEPRVQEFPLLSLGLRVYSFHVCLLSAPTAFSPGKLMKMVCVFFFLSSFPGKEIQDNQTLQFILALHIWDDAGSFRR